MLDRIPIIRITGKARADDEDAVVVEFNLTILLNGQELVTLLCSPEKLEFLAAGFLCSEGLIAAKEEIRDIALDKEKGLIAITTREPGKSAEDIFSRRLIGSSGGKGVIQTKDPQHGMRENCRITISSQEVIALMGDFIQRSDVYRATGGVHSAALCTSQEIILFSDDIGRHNAIDKIFGECLLTDIPVDDRMLLTSGRVSSEIVLKVAKRNIPILISKAAPTKRGVELAHNLGITLIGFARGTNMNIYSHPWRMSDEA
jgi:FdhD protein